MKRVTRVIWRCCVAVFSTKTVRVFGQEVWFTWPFNVWVFLYSLWMAVLEHWALGIVMPFVLGIIYFNVLLHEFGHVYAARLLGYSCKGIAILPIGGAAYIEDDWQKRPLHEAIIALAGPAVNASLGLIHLCLDPFLPDSGLARAINDSMILLNACMVFFNLLPVFPMDGGRLLRAGLSAVWGQERGIKLTRFVGAFVGSACAVIAVYFGYYFAAFILMLAPALGFLEPKKEETEEEIKAALKSGESSESLKEKGIIVVKPQDFRSKAG